MNIAGVNPYPLLTGLTKGSVALLDLSANNTSLTMFWNTAPTLEQQVAYIAAEIRKQGSAIGVGGYLEKRFWYQRSPSFGSKNPESGVVQDRNIHLGIDVWSRTGTPIYAPLAGCVAAFRDNQGFLNYGPTVILSHQLEGEHFYTLYGHLARESLSGLSIGKVIKKGECFAEIGSEAVNGNWPPHLHFQLIVDLPIVNGDYPGVCSELDRAFYERNCPDPLPLSGLSQFLVQSSEYK